MLHNIIPIDAADRPSAFQRCHAIVKRGGVIAYPTDTFYGLGADPNNAAAVARLFSIKGRNESQPILLLIADVREVEQWAAVVTQEARLLMNLFWPGPLTIVFQAQPGVLDELTAGTRTIGLRIPASVLTRELLTTLGGALTGTSANRSGMPSPRNADEAAAALGDTVDAVLDGGETPGGKPSTIVDCSMSGTRILREGAVPASVILQAIAGDTNQYNGERIVA